MACEIYDQARPGARTRNENKSLLRLNNPTTAPPLETGAELKKHDMTLNRFLALALAARACAAAQNSPSPLPTVAKLSPTPLPDAGTTHDGDMEALRRELEAMPKRRAIIGGGADGRVVSLRPNLYGTEIQH